ncbi:MAG: Lrp/AsnC family transcriptional regulator [Gemmatimonadota bacterium]
MIDAVDAKIIAILQANGRETNAEIARRVDMAASAVLERIRKLEARGVIQGYTARIDPKAVDLGLLAFVFVRADERVGEESAGRQLAAIPEVLEVHHVAGEDCYLVKVRAEGPEALGRILRERFGAIGHVRTTRTTIVLSSVKESTELLIPQETVVEGAA